MNYPPDRFIAKDQISKKFEQLVARHDFFSRTLVAIIDAIASYRPGQVIESLREVRRLFTLSQAAIA